MAKKKAARPARPAARTRKTAARKASASPRSNGRAAGKTAGSSAKKAKSRKTASGSSARTAKTSKKTAAADKRSSSRRSTSAKAASRSTAAAGEATRKPKSAATAATGRARGNTAKTAPGSGTGSARRANAARPRRTDEDVHGVPSSLDLDRPASAVRTGRAELEQKLHEHTSTSPALTAGDVDADWGSAESVGDEAPGGDNPTPDQDVVEEIGRALGVEYDDDEELQGGEEIAERDRRRWELDPASSDDFEER